MGSTIHIEIGPAGTGLLPKISLKSAVAAAVEGKFMNSNTRPNTAFGEGPILSQKEGDLRSFVSTLPDMAIAGEYPGDPRLNAITLPTSFTRAILRDEAMEDDIAWIDASNVEEPVTANDVLSALWRHRDYLDRVMVIVHAKARSADTVEIGIRLEPAECISREIA